jgi:hypothetical protein
MRPVSVAEAEPQPEIRGRVVITWPRPEPRATPPLLGNWGVEFREYETGQVITTGFKAAIVMGTDRAWKPDALIVDLTLLADENGDPIIGETCGELLALNRAESDEYRAWRDSPQETRGEFTGDPVRTGVFRYLVAEMRVAGHEQDAGTELGSETEEDPRLTLVRHGLMPDAVEEC